MLSSEPTVDWFPTCNPSSSSKLILPTSGLSSASASIPGATGVDSLSAGNPYPKTVPTSIVE